MRKEHYIPFEKSRRVIYPDRQGKEIKYRRFAVKFFGMLSVLCLLYCLSILLFMGYGTKFFLIWGAMAACFGFLSWIYTREKWLERLPKWFKRSVIVCCVAGLLLFGVVEGLILSRFGEIPQSGADYVIVLGAQWKANGPSYVLQKRLDAATSYLMTNPDTKVIVSGGQGSNEPISEAAGMRDYLLAAGVEEERILMEDQSTNTYENLVFSSRLFDKTTDKIVLVTNNFHVYRAVKIAEKQSYAHVEGLAAASYPTMIPNNLLREFFGVMKDFFAGNL